MSHLDEQAVGRGGTSLGGRAVGVESPQGLQPRAAQPAALLADVQRIGVPPVHLAAPAAGFAFGKEGRCEGLSLSCCYPLGRLMVETAACRVQLCLDRAAGIRRRGQRAQSLVAAEWQPRRTNWRKKTNDARGVGALPLEGVVDGIGVASGDVQVREGRREARRPAVKHLQDGGTYAFRVELQRC